MLRCLMRYIPLVACRVEAVNVNVSMKSGMARIGGSKIPSPIRPALRLSSAMRRA